MGEHLFWAQMYYSDLKTRLTCPKSEKDQLFYTNYSCCTITSKTDIDHITMFFYEFWEKSENFN